MLKLNIIENHFFCNQLLLVDVKELWSSSKTIVKRYNQDIRKQFKKLKTYIFFYLCIFEASL